MRSPRRSDPSRLRTHSRPRAIVLATLAAALAVLVAAATQIGPVRGSATDADALAATAPGASAAPPARARAAALRRPNIVVVTTDDQDLASLSPRTMPNVARLLQRQGTTFTDSVVSGPLCCPARAVFLTGQYGHNNGVTWNTPGYPALRDKGNTLPVWLQRAGYRTAHLGRYLNGYPKTNAVPPGWNEWHSAVDIRSYYRYPLRVNGRKVRYGGSPSDYITRVLNRKAVGMIRRYAPSRKPLFLSVDQIAPHANALSDPGCGRHALPDPQDRSRFAREPLPRPPSFNEVDVRDKPSFVSSRPRLDRADLNEMQRRHRCRLASLRAVDRGVGQIHNALRRVGELDDTVIVFTSDNGYYAGEHRIPSEKVVPYEEAVRVPLVVRAPGLGSPARIGRSVANIDLAPTILDLARAGPCRAPGACRTLDGRSFLGLLRGSPSGWPANRGILLEMEVPARRAGAHTPCDYEGIRTARDVLIEHHSSTRGQQGACVPNEETELYDLASDPHQLRNLSPAPPGSAVARRELRLAVRLARLEGCAGVAGRDQPEPGTAFCE